MRKLTAEWVRKAEADHLAAQKMAENVPPVHDVVCFHCQQLVEKYLKALLQEIGPPRAEDAPSGSAPEPAASALSAATPTASWPRLPHAIRGRNALPWQSGNQTPSDGLAALGSASEE